MASFIDSKAKDDFIKCPYNPAHIVKQSRMVYHMVKCAKNPNIPSLIDCPYNAKHKIRPQDMVDHMYKCPSLEPNVVRDDEMAEFMRWAKESKTSNLPEQSSLSPDPEENWDDFNPPEEKQPISSVENGFSNQTINGGIFSNDIPKSLVNQIIANSDTTIENGPLSPINSEELNSNAKSPPKIRVNRARANYRSVVERLRREENS
ncbi:uncharacterized protein LOC141851035 [Brevipalpus obovatus]|uniref:uncharacterized protein LOC141851035 n=1 Tax=Brevipalpus obovatus TaxID=246614 RepID=UPI003D9E17F0